MVTKDIAGEDFGGVTAVEPTELTDEDGHVIWKCRCNHCGAPIYIRRDRLVNMAFQSCGCILTEAKKRGWAKKR